MTRTKFAGPEQITAAIEYVAGMGERVALIGGTALQLYGSPRMTADVDVASNVDLPGKSRGRLAIGGQKLRAPNGVDVDVVIRDGEYAPLYEDAILAARRLRGVPIPVATPEHIAAMKMASGRHGKDEADLEWLIAEGKLNLPLARQIIRRHLGPYAVQEFDSTVSLVEWKKKEGKL